MKRLLLILLTLVILAAAGLAIYTRQQLDLPSGQPGGLVEIPRGLAARDVVGLLAEKNVIRNPYVALAYIFYSGQRQKLKAGEYFFDRPMTVPEVVNKLTSGAVHLHKFTLAEGLTLEQAAKKWEEQGFGTAGEFLNAASSAVDTVRRIDDKAVSVEGYLYPETYSFPSGTTARQAVDTMIDGSRKIIERLQQTVPMSSWPLNLHDTVTLASLIEGEALHAEERPLIASVYLNRLNRHILLQCDPTVIYALVKADRYRGSLTLADLQFASPYNTYVNAGLPPGPITNPGYPSLLAAIQPATTSYLYFVRTTEARHTFSETLEAHNRAVAAYRKMSKPARGRGRPRI